MPKNQTAWTSGSKNSSPWVTVGKSGTAWVGHNTKNATTFTVTPKGTTGWSNESIVQIPYTYDSVAVYDSTFTYDYTMIVANQTNSKTPTAWASV